MSNQLHASGETSEYFCLSPPLLIYLELQQCFLICVHNLLKFHLPSMYSFQFFVFWTTEYQILSLSASCELYLWVLFQTIKFWKLSRSLELSLLIKIFRKSVCRSRRQVISSIISFFRPVIWQSFNRQTSQKSQETWVSTKGAWQGSPAKLQVTRPPLFTGRESKEMKKLQFGRLDEEFKVLYYIFSLYIVCIFRIFCCCALMGSCAIFSMVPWLAMEMSRKG